VSEPSAFDARKLFLTLAQHGVQYVTIGGIAIQSTPSAQLLAGCAARSATSYLYRVSTSQMRSVPHSISPAGTRSSAA
jgi:hypothetical protein